ncbi:MAG: protein arginine kinase [Parachlamydiaceae bacterium]|nr:protein arginine kinase [Parachlamydiaceae bacterium]
MTKPWEDNANPIWLASSVSLIRNIEKFKFPGKLGSDRKKQIISLVTKDLLAMDGLSNPYLIKGEDLSYLEKEFLIEHFFSSQQFSQAHSGDGFFIDDSGEFIVSINLRDHLHLQLIDCKGELENTWSRLVKIETTLGKNINYSYQTKFGFLTADPTECGTALIVTVYLQVPGLIHTEKIDEILEKYDDESLTITGIQGNPTEIVGDILMVRNNYTLGITEENIVSSLRSFTTKILLEEQSTRIQIKQSNNIEFKDKVSRAFGILIHSYQIEAVEALNALSLLKFGIDANWVVGIDNKQINQLIFNCHRAHLLSQFTEKINKEDIPHKRSEYIHKALKNVQLAV